jgi:hypothetical protein
MENRTERAFHSVDAPRYSLGKKNEGQLKRHSKPTTESHQAHLNGRLALRVRQSRRCRRFARPIGLAAQCGSGRPVGRHRAGESRRAAQAEQAAPSVCGRGGSGAGVRSSNDRTEHLRADCYLRSPARSGGRLAGSHSGAASKIRTASRPRQDLAADVRGVES